MNTNAIKTWALVNKQTSELEALEFTREMARETKRSLSRKGVETKIAQLKFNKFAR